MALGKPAISPLRSVDLRALQGVIDQIRERLRLAEVEIDATTAQAGQTTLRAGQQNISIANLQQQINALQAQLASLLNTAVAPDNELAVVGARVFAPHVPLTQDTLPQDGATILATQIFGD